MTEIKLKWSRRKQERPAEIISAAMDEFVEKGFAATKLTDVAKRAGVAKGTLFRYFETKEQLFHAVVKHALTANLSAIEQAAVVFDGSLSELIPMLLNRAAGRMGDSRFPAILRMVLSESRAFPNLARIWHDEVIARMLGKLSDLIKAAQAREEVSVGDPNLLAISIMGPMIMALLFHEVFGSQSPYAPNLEKLAAQHADIILKGITVKESPQEV
ncbi:MAG: TetR/AcrR family transcriptional regulator [Gammaproteobacteria bacterium]|nr:MAG: TetR/AcrR family transcriptional regulator [Gammaproteobacteria bacterium]